MSGLWLGLPFPNHSYTIRPLPPSRCRHRRCGPIGTTTLFRLTPSFSLPTPTAIPPILSFPLGSGSFPHFFLDRKQTCFGVHYFDFDWLICSAPAPDLLSHSLLIAQTHLPHVPFFYSGVACNHDAMTLILATGSHRLSIYFNMAFRLVKTFIARSKSSPQCAINPPFCLETYLIPPLQGGERPIRSHGKG